MNQAGPRTYGSGDHNPRLAQRILVSFSDDEASSDNNQDGNRAQEQNDGEQQSYLDQSMTPIVTPIKRNGAS